MRKALHNLLLNYPEDVVLLHPDMWPFDTPQALNSGIQEPNIVNLACGLASTGKSVIVYAVAGFVLYKAYEQIKYNVKGWAEFSGSITFVNAGHNGCYSACGRGHEVQDDWQLCSALGLELYEPKDVEEFVQSMKEFIPKKGARFVRLGFDTEPR